MPKIKTNRAAAKRFKVTGTGKLKRNKAYKSHIYKEVHKEKEKSETGNYYRCNKCKEHEEGFTISVRFGSRLRRRLGNGKNQRRNER